MTTVTLSQIMTSLGQHVAVWVLFGIGVLLLILTRTARGLGVFLILTALTAGAFLASVLAALNVHL